MEVISRMMKLPLWIVLFISAALLACGEQTPAPGAAVATVPGPTGAATSAPSPTTQRAGLSEAPRASSTATPRPGAATTLPAPTTQIPDGSTWILQTLDGDPVLGGTFVWLRLDGDTYSGLDGCNTFGGRFKDGKPVAGDDGEFNAPPITMTLIGCSSGIEEQADRYRELLKKGERFRVVDKHLEILDGEGETRLGFVQQAPLAGGPVGLVGTEWRLVLEDGVGEDVNAATLVFLNDHHAVGITTCRGYVASYEASGERLDFWSTAMTEYGGASPCAEELRIQEGQFTNDLSRAVEYSVSEEEGTRRLRIRTSRGRTVTFEPLAAEVESVFDVEWHLKALVTVGEWGDPDVPPLRATRLIPGTEVTARFHEKGVSGFGGCNFYGARMDPEEPIAREDGSFAKGTMAIEATAMGCLDPPGVTEQERRFTGLISNFERYRIYGQLLVVHTKDDVVLMFQAE